MSCLHKALACMIALSVAVPLPTVAQQDRPATPFNAEELDQILASSSIQIRFWRRSWWPPPPRSSSSRRPFREEQSVKERDHDTDLRH